jgi:serine/threonine protein kinase
MGEVYRAKDPRLGRDVAIKVLPATFSSDADRLKRFEQEARAAGVLNHPNVAIVYDVGSHDGAPYVVQELLEGETLRSELASGRFSPQSDRVRRADRPRTGGRARKGDRAPGPQTGERHGAGAATIARGTPPRGLKWRSS